MIKIEQRASKQLKTKEALFVSFDFDPDRVGKIKTLPKRIYDTRTKEWEVPIADINKLIQLFITEEIKIVGKVTTKVAKSISEVVRFDPVDLDESKFKTTPRAYQLDGVKYGLANNKFLLGDEQGLGKTKQAIDIAVQRKGQFKHCLIVCCKNALKWNWRAEIQTHSNEKSRILGYKVKTNGKEDVGSIKERYEDLCKDHREYFLITNIETLRDEKIAKKIEDMCNKGIIGMTVVDEIHMCKNPTSIQGKALHSCRSYYKMALTGTPLMNSPLDIYQVLKWLDAEYHSFTAFKNRYAIMGGFNGYSVVGYRNLDELQNKLDAVMLRRKKEDHLKDLPEKIHIPVLVEMDDKQRNVYEEVKKGIMENIDKIKSAPNPLAQLTRLRQITGYPGIISTHLTTSAKLEAMKDMTDEIIANGQKVIIFSNFTQVTTAAREMLKEYHPLLITGETKDGDRMPIVNEFQSNDDSKVIIGTIGAMGTGLTLTASSNIIFIDEPWNRATKDQAEDRIHRIGQTHSVSIYTLVTKDTIDERINSIVESKGAMSDYLVDNKNDDLTREKLVDFLLS